MRITSIPAYLVGNRRAILEIASDRGALGVAALLVLSAALARNYDRASLLDEPWRLLGPFVASLAISGVLFATIYTFARGKYMESPGMGRAYLSFLALYWMMAPMAWLYGIPYERFYSPVDANGANLLTLAFVSLWRVALMTRVVSVVFDLRVRAVLPLVMLVAEIAALTALYLVPLPVINMMGGIPVEQDIAFSALLVTVLCWLTLPLWVVMAGIAVFSIRNRPVWRVPATPDRPGGRRAALACAALVLAAWAALLPFTQPEQRLARRVERVYRRDGPAAALALMSAHNRAEFPPDWQPPPRRFPGDSPTSEVLDMLEALADHPHADWVGELYARRFRDRVEYDSYQWPNELLDQHAVRLAAILSRLREGPEMARVLHGSSYAQIEQHLASDQTAIPKDAAHGHGDSDPARRAEQGAGNERPVRRRPCRGRCPPPMSDRCVSVADVLLRVIPRLVGKSVSHRREDSCDGKPRKGRDGPVLGADGRAREDDRTNNGWSGSLDVYACDTYQPDPPARGMAPDPRWRVGLVGTVCIPSVNRSRWRAPEILDRKGRTHGCGRLSTDGLEPRRSGGKLAQGAADFRVGGRIFATLAMQHQGYGNLMLSPALQQALRRRGAGRLLADTRRLGEDGMHPHPAGRRERAADAQGPPACVELAGREEWPVEVRRGRDEDSGSHTRRSDAHGRRRISTDAHLHRCIGPRPGAPGPCRTRARRRGWDGARVRAVHGRPIPRARGLPRLG